MPRKSKQLKLVGSEKDDRMYVLRKIVHDDEERMRVEAEVARVRQLRDFAHMQLANRVQTLRFTTEPPLSLEFLAEVLGFCDKSQVHRFINRVDWLSEHKFMMVHEKLKALEAESNIPPTDQIIPWRR